jgi:branched-chain amino acid transport system permease protein
VPFPAAFAAAIVLPTAAAWVMAKAAVKFTAAYLAMVTFAFHSMCFTLFINWQPVTNGWEGLVRIPPASFLGLAADTPTRVYFLLLAVAALAVAAAWRIRHSGSVARCSRSATIAWRPRAPGSTRGGSSPSRSA